QAEEGISDYIASEDANLQNNELISSLAGKMHSPNDCYEPLERRLLEGHFEDVNTALNMRDENGKMVFFGYRFALLRARCAKVLFLLYARRASPLGWPSEAEGAEMRRLARQATSAYEEAFRLADSDFERACVYARWHELHAMRRFEADSLLLRTGSPFERSDGPADQRLSKQAVLLRKATAQALDSLRVSGKPLEEGARQEFLDVFIDEYRKLGRMGVPDAVFNELLEDVAAFLQKAIHPRVLANPGGNNVTIRYHIWYALTGPRPDEIDAEFIDRQTGTVAQYLRDAFAGSLPAHEDEMSSIFRDVVELERGNRFIPGLKRPLWPYEWYEARHKYDKSIVVEVLEQIDKSISRIIDNENRMLSRMSRVRRSRTFEEVEKERVDLEKKLEERTVSSMRSLAAQLMSELNTYQRIMRFHQPAGTLVGGFSGTGHDDSGIMVYTAKDSGPVPPYPWKKVITPVDHCMKETKEIAARILKAIGENDTTLLDTLTTESRDFSKDDMRRLTRVLKEEMYGGEPQKTQDINDVLIEKEWSWSVVRVQPPAEAAERTLVLVFRWKEREYWLAWAGIVEEWAEKSLANVLEQLRGGLELLPEAEPVEIVPPAGIASIEEISETASLEPLGAGHSWQVRLAFGKPDESSPLKLLYCRAEWTDETSPPRTIPFKRYAARHLGPVIWTVSNDGFRQDAPSLNSRPPVPMSLRGEGCVYA
ncbi:MAG: hypothetical protein ACYS8Z_26415, partial [Planctomycetota bacterium]